MGTKDPYKLTKLAIAILDVTVNYSDVVVTTVFSVRYNQTFNHCLRGFPSVVASVFPLVYFRFINPKYVFVRRLVGVLFGYVVTISHFEVLLETGSVLYRIALWDFGTLSLLSLAVTMLKVRRKLGPYPTPKAIP